MDQHTNIKTPPPAQLGRIADILNKEREQLVDTGRRNSLIHTNRQRKRANALTIINGQADDVFEILRAQGKAVKFLATVSDEPSTDEPVKDEPVKLAPGNYRGDIGRYSKAIEKHREELAAGEQSRTSTAKSETGDD